MKASMKSWRSPRLVLATEWQELRRLFLLAFVLSWPSIRVAVPLVLVLVPVLELLLLVPLVLLALLVLLVQYY